MVPLFPSKPPHQTCPVSLGCEASLISYWRISPCSQLERLTYLSSIETRKSVMSDGTGMGQPSTSTEGTSMTFSTCQCPSDLCQCHMLLLSAAPTKPWTLSGL